MTEPTTHALFDFDSMPLTTDQKILAALERIEALLTPKALAGPHGDLRAETAKAPVKGRK